MQSIRDFVSSELKWTQPNAFKSEYILSIGEETLANLKFRSSWGTLATAETADGCWTFKRVGFWQTRVTVRACNAETDLAVFRNNTWSGGGTLELASGQNYRATTNFWQSSLEFRDEQDQALFRLKSKGMIHFSAQVEFEPLAASCNELALLMCLGWYLLVMMQQDAAAAVAVTAAV